MAVIRLMTQVEFGRLLDWQLSGIRHHIKLGHRYSRKKQSGMSNGKLGAHLYHAVGGQAKVARCIVAESREMHK